MLADFDGIGEWGFSALLEIDGRRILFDTGAYPDTVLRNLQALNVSLADTADVILSHHHYDHVNGLVPLRRALAPSDPSVIARAHVGKGMFAERVEKDGQAVTEVEQLRRDYQAAGGEFVEYDAPREILPGAWLTGPVPRRHPERNWTGSRRLVLDGGATVEDDLPEDQSLVIDTEQGLVVVTGCGHAGVVNICEYARQVVRDAPIHALIGGIHLFEATDETLDWTAARLREFGLQNLLGTHCTGLEAVYRLRQLCRLTRATAAVGAVGGGFTLGQEMKPGEISR